MSERRTIPAGELDTIPPGLREFIHSRTDGAFCGSCNVKVKAKHELSNCTSCNLPLKKVYVEPGALDIQLRGRPTIYVVGREETAEQGYAS